MKCLASSKTLIERVKEEEQMRALKVVLTAVCITAFDKCGLCRKTVEKLMNGVSNMADNINKGYISLDDLLETLKDEYDCELKFIK